MSPSSGPVKLPGLVRLHLFQAQMINKLTKDSTVKAKLATANL